MGLDANINNAIKQAMLAKNEALLRTLRGIKSAFLLAKTEKGASGELTDEQETKIIQKLFNQRREAYTIFNKEGREELALKEKEEMDILESYLPKQMSDDELIAALKEMIAQVGAYSPAEMGKVMGVASKKLAGQAEGARISAMVRQLLSA